MSSRTLLKGGSTGTSSARTALALHQVNAVSLVCGHWIAVPLAFQLLTVFWEFLHSFAQFLFNIHHLGHGSLSFHNKMQPNKSRFCPPLWVIHPSRCFLSSTMSRSPFSLSLSEGMQYTVGPQFIDMNLFTFLCMYYIILLLMTDKYTELIFILLHFIYT